jgi:antitoxin ParD1/3/4
MSRQIALGARLEKFIEEQVASGRYESADDIVRTALNLLQEQEENIQRAWTVEELRREIEKGMDNGPGIPAEEVFEELRQRGSRSASAKAGG